MKNQSRLYKSIAICASVIAALAMLVPTVTSAVGSSASSNSNHNAASAPSAPSAPSTSSTRSSSTASSGSNEVKWKELKGRNLKWRYGDKEGRINFYELHLSPVDKNKPVNGNRLVGQNHNGVDCIFGDYKGDATGLVNQINTIVIDEDMTLSDAEQMFYNFAGLTKVTGLEHVKFNNLGNVSLQSMFSNCPNLETLEGIQNWDISNVTNTSNMFSYDKNLKNIDVSGWKTNNKTNMFAMFDHSGVESLNLKNWNFTQNKFKVFWGDDKGVTPGTALMYQNSGLRDLTLPTAEGNENVSGWPDGIWRMSGGESGIKPGENVILNYKRDKKSKYIRIVRDYIKVTFNRADYGSVTCVVDVLQGGNKTYYLNNTKLLNCVHNDSDNPSVSDDEENDKKISAKELGEKREELAKYAESIGLNYTAKLIRNSKSSSLSALKNLLKEAESSRSAPMTFDQIKAVLGINKKDTVVWDINKVAPYDFIAKNRKTGVYIPSNKSNSNSEIVRSTFEQFVPDDKVVNNTRLHAWFDATFTATIKNNKKPDKPRPCIPQIINPAPQPAPTPLPEPKQELKPDSTTDLGGFSGFGGRPAIPNKTPGQSKCICPNAQENKLNKSDDSSSDGVRRGYLITTGTAATCWIISSIAALFAGFFAGLAIATRKFAAR